MYDILEIRETHWLLLGINFGVFIYASLFLKAKLPLGSNQNPKSAAMRSTYLACKNWKKFDHNVTHCDKFWHVAVSKANLWCCPSVVCCLLSGLRGCHWWCLETLRRLIWTQVSSGCVGLSVEPGIKRGTNMFILNFKLLLASTWGFYNLNNCKCFVFQSSCGILGVEIRPFLGSEKFIVYRWVI